MHISGQLVHIFEELADIFGKLVHIFAQRGFQNFKTSFEKFGAIMAIGGLQ